MKTIREIIKDYQVRRYLSRKRELEARATEAIRIEERDGRLVLTVKGVHIFYIKDMYLPVSQYKDLPEYITQTDALVQLKRLRESYVYNRLEAKR